MGFASHEADRSSLQPKSCWFHECEMAQHVRNWGPINSLIGFAVLPNLPEKTKIVST